MKLYVIIIAVSLSVPQSGSTLYGRAGGQWRRNGEGETGGGGFKSVNIPARDAKLRSSSRKDCSSWKFAKNRSSASNCTNYLFEDRFMQFPGRAASNNNQELSYTRGGGKPLEYAMKFAASA